MPDVAPEQTGVTQLEQAVGDGEQQTAVDPTIEGAVSNGDVAVAVGESTFNVADLLNSDDGILQVAEKYPNLKGLLEKAKLDGENTGRQRREAELRRDQGSIERAQAYHEWLLTQIREYGDIPPDLAKQTPLMVKANEDYVRAELGKAWVETTLGHFGESEAGIIRSLTDSMKSDPDSLADLAAKTWDAAANNIRKSALVDLSLSDIPSGSKLHQEITARIQSELTSELGAQRASGARRENPPTTPVGAIAGGFNAEEIASMPDADRSRFMQSLSNADFKKVKETLLAAAYGTG